MARARDKFYEAQYHLRHMEEEFRRYEQNDETAAQRFQWFTAAFVTSARSVTFVIQSEYKHARGFEEWYADVRSRLKEDEIAALVLKLRNTMQKQGNRLPMFQPTIVARSGNSYRVRIDLSRKDSDRVVAASVTLSSESMDQCAVRLNTPGVVIAADLIAGLGRSLGMIGGDFTNPATIEREIICDENLAPMPFPIFLGNCAEYLERLEVLVSEAEHKFEGDRLEDG